VSAVGPLLAVMCCGAGPLFAVPPGLSVPYPPLTTHRSPPAAEPGSELTVTLLTYETGGAIWERYGHNALWIHDGLTGVDDHYDYGRFSFERPHFLLRFVQGRMWYSMGHESNVDSVIRFYIQQGRRVWAQELELSPAERLALRSYLERNYRPENREYFYDYYRDNCSTRIRDAIDRVVGGALHRWGERSSGMTWRDETRRINQNNRLLYTGMLVALGEPVDVEMSRWEQMFLPGRLRESLDSLQLPGPDGSLHPLVKTERVLAEGGRWPVPARPANWTLGYLVAGVLGGGLFAGLSRTRVFLPLATLWMLLAGLAGGFLAWLWTWSFHWATWRNENLFLFNLLALGLAVVLPSALRGKAWARRPARVLALLVLAVAGLGLLLKLLPAFRQHDLEVIALVLPIHAGVCWGLWRTVRDPRGATAERSPDSGSV
jgi:Domain of unknown function (DUF4105)